MLIAKENKDSYYYDIQQSTYAISSVTHRIYTVNISVKELESVRSKPELNRDANRTVNTVK